MSNCMSYPAKNYLYLSILEFHKIYKNVNVSGKFDPYSNLPRWCVLDHQDFV